MAASSDQIEKASKIIDTYISKGVFKFEDIASHLYQKLGDKAETIFDAVKAAYALSFVRQSDDSIADKMDSDVRKKDFLTIKNKKDVFSRPRGSQSDSGNTSNGLQNNGGAIQSDRGGGGRDGGENESRDNGINQKQPSSKGVHNLFAPAIGEQGDNEIQSTEPENEDGSNPPRGVDGRGSSINGTDGHNGLDDRRDEDVNPTFQNSTKGTFAEQSRLKRIEQDKAEDAQKFSDSEEEGARFMAGTSPAVNKRFNDELKLLANGQLAASHVFQLGTPTAILRSVGFPDLPIEMKASRIIEKGAIKHHEFEIADIENLPAAIENPVAVFTYGDKDKTQNVITEIEKNGKKFLVGVHFNQQPNGVEVNDIRGLFPKDTHEWLNWITKKDSKGNGLPLYLNKEKVQTTIKQQQTNPAEVPYLDLNSITKVVNDFENPTVREDSPNFMAAYTPTTIEQKALKVQLDAAQADYQAAKTAYDKKKKELTKGLNAAVVDLFGQTAEQRRTQQKLFDEKPVLSAAEKALQPYRTRVDKAAEHLSQLHNKYMGLEGQESKQMAMFMAGKANLNETKIEGKAVQLEGQQANGYGAISSKVQREGSEVAKAHTDLKTLVAVWKETKYIDFTGTTRVESAADVAHIMRLLEDKAVEHAFAVHCFRSLT